MGILFMSANSYWYLGLAVSSAALLVYIFFKTRNPRIMLLFWAMVGLGYIIETVIYVFLGSYQYYPKLLTNKSYFDSNLGSVASNALSLPVIAASLSAFSLNWLWILLFTGFFTGIEWLFLELNIYEHNWWRLWFTALGLPVYFAFAKWIYRRMYRPLRGMARALLLYLITGAISGTLVIGPIILFSNRMYTPGWFPDPGHDTTAFSAVYYLGISLFLVIVVTRYWKHPFNQYLFALICLLSVDLVLKAAGIQQSLAWWDEGYFVVSQLAVLTTAQAAYDYLSKDPPIWKR